jgi:4-amino-4-deoxy-L-arabinose transferase-like glycosyltransferase
MRDFSRKALALLTRSRFIVYALYALYRMWILRKDAVFPICDGLGYFAKAAWMAQDPLQRLLLGSFDYNAIRPPAPMWLTLPGMLVRPSFSVFALLLMVWMLVFVEIGLRCVLRGRRRDLRGAAAVLILAGIGYMYDALAYYYIDLLFAAMALAALGLGLLWARRGGWAAALGCGVCLCLGLLTKPAGIFVHAAVGLAVVIEWTRLARFRRRGGLSVLPPRRAWLQALALGVLTLPGLLALLFTPYRFVLGGMTVSLNEGTLGREAVQEAWSLDSLLYVLRMFAEDTGLPLALVLVLLPVLALLKGMARRRKADGAPLPGLLAAGLFLILYLVMVPMKMHRYLTPGIMALVCATVLAAPILSPRRGRSIVLGLALLALLWRALFLASVIPPTAWVAATGTRFPMQRLHGFLGQIDEAFRESGKARPLVFAAEILEQGEALWSARMMRDLRIEPAMRVLRFESDIELWGPPFPDFDLSPMPRFLDADFLMVRSPSDFPLPVESTSADWKRLNDLLWNNEMAATAGWTERMRLDNMVLYRSDATAGSEADRAVPLAARRARLFLKAGFRSPEGLELAKQMTGLGALRGSEPTDRVVEIRDMRDGGRGVLAHAEYEGNPLPHTLIFRTAGISSFLLEARKEGEEGDGTVIIVERLDAGGAVMDRVESPLGHQADGRIDLPKQWRDEAAVNESLRVRVDAGPRGHTWHDCVTVGPRGE